MYNIFFSTLKGFFLNKIRQVYPDSKSFDTFKLQIQPQFQSQTVTLPTKRCQRHGLRLNLKFKKKRNINRMDKLVELDDNYLQLCTGNATLRVAQVLFMAQLGELRYQCILNGYNCLLSR